MKNLRDFKIFLSIETTIIQIYFQYLLIWLMKKLITINSKLHKHQTESF